MLRKSVCALVVCVLFAHVAAAVEMKDLRDPPDAWFTSPEGRQILANILTWQNADGGWPKDYDYNTTRLADDSQIAWEGHSNFDDYTTYTEIRLMARAFKLTGEQPYRDAFDRGVAFVLESQYPNGGWPQRYPPPDNYGRYITFNDNAMTRVVYLVRDIAIGHDHFTFVDDDLRAKCREAYGRAVDCILKLQIKQDGVLSGWCAQYDPDTLAPEWARSYEPPSINSSEGSEVVHLLMDIPDPDDRVQAAVHAAAAWFERSKITGKRMEFLTDADGKRVDRVLVDDPSAPPIWARFYDIETNQPIYCDRDGTRFTSMDQVPRERRLGYAWYSTNGNRVLDRYAKWKKQFDNASGDAQKKN